MKVVLLAILTALFSLSITHPAKIAGKAGMKHGRHIEHACLR